MLRPYAVPPRSRLTWLGWVILAAICLTAGFLSGWAVCLLSVTK
jgi:hypothetical protein